MKCSLVIAGALIAACFTGCASTNATRILADGIGAAGGALLGNTLGHGSPILTAAGAGAGVLLGETLHAGSTVANEKSYAAGYEKGRSDTTKHHYQELIERQRSAEGESTSLFELPLPERELDGAILNPGTKTLRIHE